MWRRRTRWRAAWTLLYPDFYVVVPKGGQIKVPLAYAVSLENPDLPTLLNTWIDRRHGDGSLEQAHDDWGRGLHAEEAGPRWSVIRNVPGWVD